MNIKQYLLLGTLLLASAASRVAGASETLSYVDLIHQLTDLEHLAVLPQPGEGGAMWASTDRASQYDAAKDKYIHWDANGDGTGFIRKEGDKIVMAEMEGPGVIWRIWSAQANAGHVKIYLDGSDKPAVDMPFHDYFDARREPFKYPALSYDAARGKDLYFPIPYQKSCKVVADPGWGMYYHFTFATLPKGTTVPTFTTNLSADEIAALKQANDYLTNKLGTDPAGQRAGEMTIRKTVSAAAGQTVEVARIDGPQAITALRVKTSFKDRDDEIAALRKMALRITWDGQDKPAVWCPLGDFFGTAPGENLFQSFPSGMTKDGYYAFWYMPFAKSAVVELVNEDESSREVKFELVHAPLTRPIEQLCRFHVKWHRDLAPVRKDRWPDWTVLQTEGRGRFCGQMLHIWVPNSTWWGEGDEKFFVDGEKYPSTFGTGSEDYFGYAWGTAQQFVRPYHAQTYTKNNVGDVSVVRWQLVDSVPFQKSFEASIEKYDHPGKGTRYASTVYWYLSADGTDPLESVPVEKRVGYSKEPPLELKGLGVIGQIPGTVWVQDMGAFKAGTWRDGKQLIWQQGKPGNKLKLGFTVDSAGAKRVEVALTKARDYGIFQFYLDGTKIGEPIDLYNDPEVIATGPVTLGTRELTAGKHTLMVEVVGANPKAVKAYMFGIDYVNCETVK